MLSFEFSREPVRARPGANAITLLNSFGILIPGLPNLVKIVMVETRIFSLPNVSKHGCHPERVPPILRPSSPFQELRGLRDTYALFTQPVVLVVFDFVFHLPVKHIGIMVDVYSFISEAVCPQRVDFVHRDPGPRVHNRWRPMSFENIAGAKTEEPPDFIGRIGNQDSIERLEEVLPVK